MGEKKETSLPGNYAGTVKVTVRDRDYYVHSSAPMPMMPLDDLLKALETNRAILKTCQEKLRENFIKEAFEYAAPWLLNYDSPTQDAIQAHLNINMLIPLINLKGGEAHFEKPETLNVQTRVELMRNIAEKSAFMDQLSTHNSFHTGVAMSFILIVLLALVLL
ncbi:hypothetical protein [Thiothrix nivea]|uniref:Uncharacterized protein n=1 Tax=Thiothrix nivea (strain ATCC 35100 / DSM 5205 / JP2) TaxID=870187 RepID=A0A656HCP0_THINJ|nr:hypothetical protein [Thiothrix nivea]EIJ34648.1 hypothetical protein Thini_2076 [Thiothrix nivea DSM 5205]